MKFPGHLANVGDKRNSLGLRWGNQKEGDHFEHLGADAKIILTRIIEKQNGLAGTVFFCVRIGTRGVQLCTLELHRLRRISPDILEKNSSPCSQQVS
jgi:hypothetical protein